MGAVESEDSGADEIRGEPLLSVLVLEGLLPVGRCELKHAAVNARTLAFWKWRLKRDGSPEVAVRQARRVRRARVAEPSGGAI
jgi:hypothetical protein